MNPEPPFAAPSSARVCPSCGGEVAPNLLSCPSCHRLVHSDRLKELAESAEAAERAGDLSAALTTWREAIALLPPASRQHAILTGRIGGLSRQVEAGPGRTAAAAVPPSASPTGAERGPRDARWAGGAVTGAAGTVALIIWKFKFLAVLLLTKAKFLLLGLTKASTFFSMMAAFGLYWTVFGGWFALGFVLSIYIHEMGHVAALMRYGVPATAPLFIPGLGAVIRLQQSFVNPREDARVGLAGPIWGCAAALTCAAAYALTDYPLWGALARVGAWINLFNLTPVWQLDGSRAFHSLTRPQRWLAVTAVATAWAFTEEGLLVLVMAVGAYRAALDKPAQEPDSGALSQYISLVAVLSALILLPIQLPGR
jgi:Zn-dependent protease